MNVSALYFFMAACALDFLMRAGKGESSAVMVEVFNFPSCEIVTAGAVGMSAFSELLPVDIAMTLFASCSEL